MEYTAEQLAQKLYNAMLPKEAKMEIVEKMRQGEFTQAELDNIYTFLCAEEKITAEQKPKLEQDTQNLIHFITHLKTNDQQ